jgi:hypothetical protein
MGRSEFRWPPYRSGSAGQRLRDGVRS